MAGSRMSPSVEAFFEENSRWKPSYAKLRAIMRELPLREELKWGKPCYTLDGNNIVLIHGFKDYCALLFIKGALLNDPAKILIQQTDNVQAGRQIRFTNESQIDAQTATIRAYVEEAIAAEKAGLTIDFKPTAEFTMPVEFQSKLDADSTLRTAFDKLTPGRQKGYLLHFSTPKQAKTRESRVEKAIPQILNGKGLDD